MPPTDVSFGIHLPVRMLPGVDHQPPSAAQLNDVVDAAKDAGFSAVWITDHIVYMDPWMDCMLLLASIAGRAAQHDLKIATGVVGLPLRHPVAMAQSFATLDVLSGGNLIIGVGEGSTQSDFDALGIPFQERRKMLVDGVVALRALLSGPGASHHGPFYSFDDVTVAPAGLQKPCPPIWLSGWGSPVGLRRVARLGDGWIASAWHSSPEEFQTALGVLNSALESRGRDPDDFPNAVNTMFMYVDADGDRARQVAVPIIERTTRTTFDGEGGHFLVGDYEECKTLLRRWMDAGAKQICVWPVTDAPRQIQMFGEYLLPGL
ncbi:MAG: LLM class flavin-dependent oxidoreductase [Chloroflexi bacterium]|nr:LLM class flavin-dependent oxidoreductase [Chloroflexota bacterium]